MPSCITAKSPSSTLLHFFPGKVPLLKQTTEEKGTHSLTSRLEDLSTGFAAEDQLPGRLLVLLGRRAHGVHRERLLAAKQQALNGHTARGFGPTVDDAKAISTVPRKGFPFFARVTEQLRHFSGFPAVPHSGRQAK